MSRGAGRETGREVVLQGTQPCRVWRPWVFTRNTPHREASTRILSSANDYREKYCKLRSGPRWKGPRRLMDKPTIPCESAETIKSKKPPLSSFSSCSGRSNSDRQTVCNCLLRGCNGTRMRTCTLVGMPQAQQKAKPLNFHRKVTKIS